MAFDFPEANPFSDFHCSWQEAVDWVAKVISVLPQHQAGQLEEVDARHLDIKTKSVFATDPPYYDNISYAILADFFFAWLRRSLGVIWPDLTRRVETPKDSELIASAFRNGSQDQADAFFLDGMKKAMRNMAEASVDMPLTIYYAFKQSELAEEGLSSAGWATFLQGVVESGLVIDGTWPVRSERSARMIAIGTNALASSIVLVCRRRPADAPKIGRAEFVRLLKRELPEAIRDIRAAGVGPVDMAQAAIGPGMGVFSRYAAVLEPDDTPMPVKTALALINAEREHIASEQDASYDSDTQFAIEWFQAFGYDERSSGDAIQLANAKNLALNGVVATGFFAATRGKARLLKREELAAEWDPRDDKNPTDWEGTQHLIRRLDKEGLDAAARLLAAMPERAANVHALAFRLYQIADDKRMAEEARAYNLLATEWPSLEARAAEIGDSAPREGLLL